MADYQETEYHAIGGNCELGCAALGVVAAIYFSNEISSFVVETINSGGLTKLINQEPAVAKIASGIGGLFAGYYSGKILGHIAIYFKKRENQKTAQKETDARTDWLEQIKRNAKK